MKSAPANNNNSLSEKRPFNRTELRSELYVALAAALAGSCPVREQGDHNWIAHTTTKLTDTLLQQYEAAYYSNPEGSQVNSTT